MEKILINETSVYIEGQEAAVTFDDEGNAISTIDLWRVMHKDVCTPEKIQTEEFWREVIMPGLFVSDSDHWALANPLSKVVTISV